MKDKKTDIQNEDTRQETPSSPHEVRTEARRRLIKAGLMSVPVIMTVHSRPLFAQTNGSVGALAYGGYEGTTQNNTTSQYQTSPITNTKSDIDPFGENFDPSGSVDAGNSQYQTSPITKSGIDPFGENFDPSGSVDAGNSTFRRSRDPRSRY